MTDILNERLVRRKNAYCIVSVASYEKFRERLDIFFCHIIVKSEMKRRIYMTTSMTLKDLLLTYAH